MSKGKWPFKKTDINRMIAIAKENNLTNYRVEAGAGKTTLIVDGNERPTGPAANEWDNP
jgi:hypothetical protein